MKRLAFCLILAATVLVGGPASAGVYTDDLTKCLVKAASASDRSDFVKFIFVAMAADPTIKDMSSVTAAQRAAVTLKYVEIFQRQMFVDCRREAVDAVKYEGAAALEQSYNIMGQIAMRQLMSGPGFQSVNRDIAAHLDKDEWVALFKEAGVTTAATSTPAK